MRTAFTLATATLVALTLSACSTATNEADWQGRAENLTPGQLDAIRDMWEGPKPYTDDLIRDIVVSLCSKLEEGASMEDIIEAVGPIERGADEKTFATYDWTPWWLSTVAREGCPDLYRANGG